MPPLQAIPPEQSEFHDFVVQVVIRGNGSAMDYRGRQFTNEDDTPAPVQQATRQGGTRGNLNEALLRRAQQIGGQNVERVRQRNTPAAPTNTPPAEQAPMTEAARRQAETLARMAGIDPAAVDGGAANP